MSGMFQGDFPTYLCYGRMAAETRDTLHYASPHDLREPPHALLVNLPISLIGWLILVGVPPASIEMVMRIVFGLGMYLGLAWMLRRVFADSWWRWLAFFVVGLGSGLAWAWTLHLRPEGAPPVTLDSLRGAVNWLEQPYRWWFLDVARNLMFPLELVYHTIAFFLLGALVAKRWRLAIALQVVAALSNPFVGLQFCCVTLLALLCSRGPTWKLRAASLGVLLALVAYYKGVLGGDDVIRSLQDEHRTYLQDPLTVKDFLLGHAVPLLGLVPLALDVKFRRTVMRSGALVPLLSLFAVSLAFAEHSRLKWAPPLLPMHFTRGYLHVALWTTLLLWFRWLARRRRWLAPPAIAMALVLVLAVLPDDVLFFYDQWHDLPHVPSLAWSPDWQASLDRLERLPGERHVLATDWAFGRHVCALTRHRSAFGTPYTTPHYAERLGEVDRWKRAPDGPEPPTVRWADTVVVPGSDFLWRGAMRRSARWREELCNSAWCVYTRRR